MQKKTLRKLTIAATLLTFLVILLGAWTRLTDSGLGCPDWPGCFGHYTVPQALEKIEAAEQKFGEKVVQAKAWPEMIHRYFAGTLILVSMLAIFVGSLSARRQDPTVPVTIPRILLPLVLLQGALGMWTVTLKVHPLIVMSHLLGGFAILSLLFLYVMQLRPKIMSVSEVVAKKFKVLASIGLIVIILQIALGGWTAANYAATACKEFPFCNTGWTKDVDFVGGFDPFQKGFEFDEFKAAEQEKMESTLSEGQGKPFVNYEGGILKHNQKVAIHVTHRIGAYLVFIIVGLLALLMMREKDSVMIRHFGRALGLILIGQMLLGISNVLFNLPLSVAVAHNGGGAILLLGIIATNYLVNWQFRGSSSI